MNPRKFSRLWIVLLCHLKNRRQDFGSLCPRRYVLFLVLLLFGLFSACQTDTAQDSISGMVLDEDGPVPGAVVREQTTENFTLSDAEGHFTLEGLPPDQPVAVTAWAEGYFIVGGEEVMPGVDDLELHLHAHASEDNPDYEWLPSQFHAGEGEEQGCSECHSRAGTDLSFALPVDEWVEDAHSQSATNPRFLTMYKGTDVDGNHSPPTRYGYSRDYGSFPLPPDPDQPYYGPGYKLDFPETDGNCAACHTPAASVDDPYSIDPTNVEGVAAEGVPCDFCHKVWDVNLNEETGLPYENMPGVLSFEFRRPPEGHQFFAGPIDDVGPVPPSHRWDRFCVLCHFQSVLDGWEYESPDTFSPLQQQSQFCASCHFGVFWGTTVYNSFGEWLDSPYSDPETGQTCQDCHMPPSGATHFVRPEKGGLERDPATIFSHRMPGASDEELLQNAVSLDVETQSTNPQLAVTVTITNDQTGHHVPTDSPLRHMILLVDVTGPDGNPLPLVEGPTVPAWGGLTEANRESYPSLAARDYAGKPGTAYAKILQELWTEVSPTGAYWNPTRVLSDNRIPALGSDTTVYVFEASGIDTSEVSIRVRLLFRRAFLDLMAQKGWDVEDVVMEEVGGG
ncbi:MAG: hypothetical protein MAG431_00891 [Chloroflexi bacterium]|nr:hypothetical protein [Chloroflexota bacterium]